MAKIDQFLEGTLLCCSSKPLVRYTFSLGYLGFTLATRARSKTFCPQKPTWVKISQTPDNLRTQNRFHQNNRFLERTESSRFCVAQEFWIIFFYVKKMENQTFQTKCGRKRKSSLLTLCPIRLTRYFFSEARPLPTSLLTPLGNLNGDTQIPMPPY